MNMNIFLSKEFLEKAVKKAYVGQLTDEIQKLVKENKSLVKTIETLNAQLVKVTMHQEELEHKLKSPEYECAAAIYNMINNTIHNQTPKIVQKEVKEHATVHITTPTDDDPFKYSYAEIGWE